MLLELKQVLACSLLDKKGEQVATVEDLLFEKDLWEVQYLLLHPQIKGFPGKIRVETSHIRGIDPGQKQITLDISQDELQQLPEAQISPLLDQGKKPDENAYRKGFTAPHPEVSVETIPPAEPERAPGKKNLSENLGLLSQLLDFEIFARDKTVGRLQNVLINDENWRVRYFICQLSQKYEEKTILLCPWWIEQFNWDGRRVITDMDEKKLADCPSYEICSGEVDEYEREVFDRLGLPDNWFRPI
jgi:sporulation protein YlmC with PRC-barrel domain